MSTRQAQECIVLIVDCAAHAQCLLIPDSFNSPDEDANKDTTATENSQPSFDVAKAILKNFVLQKILASPKDRIGLVLFGADATDNEPHDEQGGFEGIVAAREVQPPDMNFVRFVEALKPTKGQADLMDALCVGADVLHKATIGAKKYRKTIFLLTDGTCQIEAMDDELKTISAHIKTEQIQLYVIGLGLFAGEGQCALSEAQQKAEEKCIEFCGNCDGAFLTHFTLLETLKDYRSKSVLQTSKCRLDLEITSHMKIPSWIYVKTKIEHLPSLKSFSSVAPEETEGKVKIERSYYPIDDVENEVEVPSEDRTKAYPYGKQLVPVTQADAMALKHESGDRCLTTLGSILIKGCDRQLMASNVECVAAEPYNESASFAMLVVTKALKDTKMGLVCRYIFRKNATPRLVLLFPSTSKPYLYLNYMPFKEDIRILSFPSLPHVKDASQLRVVDNLITSMSLMESREHGIDEELFKASKTHNPTLQRFHQLVLHHALHPQTVFTPSDPKLQKMLEMDPRVKERSDKAVEEVKNAFVLTPAEKTGGKKRKYWRDAQGFATTGDASHVKVDLADIDLGDGGEAFMRVSKDAPQGDGATDTSGGMGLSMERLAELEAFHIGTVQPIRDMNAMLGVKEIDLTTKAIRQMSAVIERLITSSIGTQFYEKALNCLEALRSACVRDKEGTRYNTFLVELRDMCELQGMKYNFWNSVREKNLTLISSAEDHNATVSQQEADIFFTTETSLQPSLPTSDRDGGDDQLDEDIFDLIV